MSSTAIPMEHHVLKTIRIPIEVKKNLSLAVHESQSLEDQVVQQLMDYREESVVIGHVSLSVPLPPNLSTYSKSTDPTLKQFMNESNPRIERCNPQQQDKQHDHEYKRVSSLIKSQIDKFSQPNEGKLDKSQWLARAMKRNPEALALMERVRPLSGQPSKFRIRPKKSTPTSQPTSETNSPRNISQDNQPGGFLNMDLLSSKDSFRSNNGSSTNLLKHVSVNPNEQVNPANEQEKKNLLDYSHLLSTVENKEVLSREALLQIIYQFMSQKGYNKSIREMEKETGVKYNGFRSKRNNNTDTMVETLFSLGIDDGANPYQLPTSELVDLNSDNEVQTASIHHHYENAQEMKISLWKDLSQPTTDSIVMEGGELKAVTLNKLIEMITGSRSEYTPSFLLTYRSFTEPAILLKKLIERFKVPKHILPHEAIAIKLRTGVVFNRWIEDYFYWDWNEKMIYDFIIFIEDYLLPDKKSATMGEKLKQKIAQKLISKNKEISLVFSEQPQTPDVPRNVFSSKLSIWDIKEEELAKQLTFMDHNIYRNIEPHELLECAWSKANLKHRSKNIILSTNYVNALSNWFECQIVYEVSLKERKMKLAKLMKLTNLIYKLNNFNSLMALSSTFNSSSVNRLLFTIAEVDETLKEEFLKNISLLDSTQNFSALRTHVKKVKPPLNVFLGTYLTDLFMTEQGNPDFIIVKQTNSQERKLINWKKRQLIASTITEIMDFKNPPYNIQQVHQIQELLKNTFENHEMVDEKKLYEKSLVTEPKNIQRREDLKQ